MRKKAAANLLQQLFLYEIREKLPLTQSPLPSSVHAFLLTPDAAHVVEADHFGVASGNKVANKLKKAGLTAGKAFKDSMKLS